MSGTEVEERREYGVPAKAAENVVPPRPSELEERVSPLESLREEASREVAPDLLTLDVPLRPGWAVRYRADVDVQHLNAWTKRARNKQMEQGVDTHKLACLILASTCDCIVKDGEDVEDPDGGPMTFRSAAFLEMFDTTSTAEGVAAWYGADGHAIVASEKVLVASGFDPDSVVAVDPTNEP